MTRHHALNSSLTQKPNYPILPPQIGVSYHKMEKRKVIVGVIDVETFLEAVLDYIRTLDPKTGNEEAKRKLNLCKSIIGILPFEADIHYNVSRIEKIVKYLDSQLRNETSLHNLLNRAKEEIGFYHKESAGEQIPHPKPHRVFGKRKRDYVLSTKEVLGAKYADFHDIYKDAKDSVINQLRDQITPEMLGERLKQMERRIEQEYTGGIDGLKIYFDAKHSDLLYTAKGEQVEEQRDFLLRMAKAFIVAFLNNNFYDLYRRISHKAKEDSYSFVFRMAKKYTDIKADNPDAGITPYFNGDGNIHLKAK